MFPLSLLYGLVMEIRNTLFDHQLLKSHKAPVPVISVGNLTVGGSGKTPFTIYLAEKLKARFPRIAIVSRGYGRKSRGLQVVCDGQKILCDHSVSGDEPQLMAQKLKTAAVVVAEKRWPAVQWAVSSFGAGLIIMDDGFQHRSMARDVDVLLINNAGSDRFNTPLPGGTLREFSYQFKRADFIIVNSDEPASASVAHKFKTRPLFMAQRRGGRLVDTDFKNSPMELQGQRVFAFCGIAGPDNFFKMLGSLSNGLAAVKRFGDHHDYKIGDLEKIYQLARAKNCSVIVCTEKDMVKVAPLYQQLVAGMEEVIPLRALTLEITVQNEQYFLEKLNSHLDLAVNKM